MRNFIYAIGVCSLLFSCNSELETLPEEFNTEGTAPLVTRVAAHPKYGVLGWGYDVTGNYMSHGKGVTLPVIDIDRFEAENFLLCEFSRAALFFCLIEKPDIKDYRLYRSISSMMSRRLYSRGILCCPPSLLWSRNQASNIPVLAGMISRHSSAILLNRLAS